MACNKILTKNENTGTNSVKNRVNAFYKDYPCTHASEAAWNKSVAAAEEWERTELGGRKPSAVAAAIVYSIGRSHALSLTQAGVVGFYQVTEVSLRNNLHFLRSKGIC